MSDRLYDSIIRSLSSGEIPTRDLTMSQVVDLLWDQLTATGVSWVGFYLDQPDEPDDRRLILGPHRDKPACSPIGLFGACGQCLLSGKPLVVRDVADLGPNYIACDPRDRSEVVLPLFDGRGHCYGVLDLDSHELNAFDDRDVEGLNAVLIAAGLTHA